MSNLQKLLGLYSVVTSDGHKRALNISSVLEKGNTAEISGSWFNTIQGQPTNFNSMRGLAVRSNHSGEPHEVNSDAVYFYLGGASFTEVSGGIPPVFTAVNTVTGYTTFGNSDVSERPNLLTVKLVYAEDRFGNGEHTEVWNETLYLKRE